MHVIVQNHEWCRASIRRRIDWGSSTTWIDVEHAKAGNARSEEADRSLTHGKHVPPAFDVALRSPSPVRRSLDGVPYTTIRTAFVRWRVCRYDEGEFEAAGTQDTQNGMNQVFAVTLARSPKRYQIPLRTDALEACNVTRMYSPMNALFQPDPSFLLFLLSVTKSWIRTGSSPSNARSDASAPSRTPHSSASRSTSSRSTKGPSHTCASRARSGPARARRSSRRG